MKINLTIPTSWRTCTTEQLELICLAQQQAQAQPPEQQPVAWKVRCFLALARLEIQEDRQTDEHGTPYFMVASLSQPETTFRLYVWQLQSFIKDQLAWLDTPPNIIRFPYPEWEHKGKTFRGPAIYLSGWSWQQYRLLKDYLDYFFRTAEKAEKKKDEQAIVQASAMVLATLYNAETDYLDETSHLPTHGYHYHPGQSTANRDSFLSFPPLRFSVIILWWGSLALKLKHDYPKCFGSSDKNAKKPHRQHLSDPTFDYARTTATLEKYMNTNEQQLQQESYTVVLQHLQDMIKQNEEIERINQKMKQKK